MKTTRTHYALTLLFIVTLLMMSQAEALAQINHRVSYEALLSEAAASATNHGISQEDEVAEIVKVIGAGGERIYAGEVAARLRQNFPQIDEQARIRLPAEVRSTLVPNGEEYERLVRVTRPLLQFCWLEGKVVPVLFRSEAPIVMTSWPNALIFSTRAMSLLTDEEIVAVSAHEVCHLIVRSITKRAVDNHDNRTLRLVELFCDAGATAILTGWGRDARPLISGLTKQQNILENEFQELLPRSDPTMKNRKLLFDTLSNAFKLSS